MGNDQSVNIAAQADFRQTPELPADRGGGSKAPKNEYISGWNHSDVEAWAQCKLRSKFADKLLNNGDWDGDRLLNLNDRGLERMGFKLRVHRTKILNEVKKLDWSFNNARVLGVFNFVDTDKNGGLDIHEFKGALLKLKVQLPKDSSPEDCFDEIDGDSNNRIDFEEFKDFIFLILQRGLREGAQRRKLMRSRASTIGSAMSSRRTSFAGGGEMEALENMVGRLIKENKELRSENTNMIRDNQAGSATGTDSKHSPSLKPKSVRSRSRSTSDITLQEPTTDAEKELRIPLGKDDVLWKKLVKHLTTKHHGLNDKEKAQLVEGDVTKLLFQVENGSTQPERTTKAASRASNGSLRSRSRNVTKPKPPPNPVEASPDPGPSKARGSLDSKNSNGPRGRK